MMAATKTDKMRWAFAALGTLIAVHALTPATAHAASDTREREALRRVQLAQQKLSQDKAQLESEKATLEQTVARLNTQLEKLKKSELQRDKDKAELTAQFEEVKRENDDLKIKLGDGQSRQAGLERDLEQTRAQLSETEGNRRRFETVATQKTKSLSLCETKNAEYFKINEQLLHEYENKGLWQVLMLYEPVTKIQQVREYGLVDGYKEKLADQRVANE